LATIAVFVFGYTNAVATSSPPIATKGAARPSAQMDAHCSKADPEENPWGGLDERVRLFHEGLLLLL